METDGTYHLKNKMNSLTARIYTSDTRARHHTWCIKQSGTLPSLLEPAQMLGVC